MFTLKSSSSVKETHKKKTKKKSSKKKTASEINRESSKSPNESYGEGNWNKRTIPNIKVNFCEPGK